MWPPLLVCLCHLVFMLVVPCGFSIYCSVFGSLVYFQSSECLSFDLHAFRGTEIKPISSSLTWLIPTAWKISARKGAVAEKMWKSMQQQAGHDCRVCLFIICKLIKQEVAASRYRCERLSVVAVTWNKIIWLKPSQKFTENQSFWGKSCKNWSPGLVPWS